VLILNVLGTDLQMLWLSRAFTSTFVPEMKSVGQKNLKIMCAVVEGIVCVIITFAGVNTVLHSCPGPDILINEASSAPLQSWRD
jgi:hypothetical protein